MSLLPVALNADRRRLPMVEIDYAGEAERPLASPATERLEDVMQSGSRQLARRYWPMARRMASETLMYASAFPESRAFRPSAP